MKTLINCRVILPAVAGLAALVTTATAWAAGCVQGPEGTANPIVFAKGKQSCEAISGYVGCTVTKGDGSCDILDPDDNSLITTITSTVESDGSLTWASTGPGKVFAGGLNGASAGNACVLFYPSGEGSTQSGIGYDTALDGEDPVYTNVQESFFCTDLNAEIVTTEPDVQPCSIVGIDEGGDTCATAVVGAVVEVWTPTYDENGAVTGTELQQCVCDDGGNATVNIYPCNLSGTDDGDPGTLENCFDPVKGDVEAPTIIEYFPDAKRCKTSGGTRSCDCIDNPFTTCNECTSVCS